MRAWRGPHKVVEVLQDGPVYILDTGEKVYLERPKPHQSGPLEFVATRAVEADIEVVMDPNPEHPVDVINDDMSRMHDQQFDYSTSGTDDELSDVMLPIPSPLVEAGPLEPEAPHPSDHSISPTRYLPQLFTDHAPPRSLSPQ